MARKKASSSSRKTSAPDKVTASKAKKQKAPAKKTDARPAAKKVTKKKTLKTKKATQKVAREAPQRGARASAANKARSAGKVAARAKSRPKSTGSTRAKAVAKKKSSRLPRPSTFSAALKLYETGFKLMQAEKFDKAVTAFGNLIKEYPDETELIDRANVLIQACENRIREAKKAPRLHGADEFYAVGITELNNHEIDAAREHLQHALKLAPKADHILYGLAAASALGGEREAALDFLKKAIHYRDENRFLAVNDDDFESLAEHADFIKLTAT